MLVQLHGVLACALAGRPEQQLANPADPEALDLVIACAGSSYETGSAFLYALQARRRAARIGSVTAVMRWTKVVTETRGLLEADAEVATQLTAREHSECFHHGRRQKRVISEHAA